MRPYLGPPRELLVRRLETDHRRAMRRLKSAMMTIAGCWLVAIALFAPHMSSGGRVINLIAGGASLAALWGFKRPSKRNLLGMLVLGWTMVVLLFVMLIGR